MPMSNYTRSLVTISSNSNLIRRTRSKTFNSVECFKFLKLDPSPLCCHVTSYMKVQFSKHSSLWDHIREIFLSEGTDVSEVGGRGDSEGITEYVK